jgi:hypothetical protein
MAGLIPAYSGHPESGNCTILIEITGTGRTSRVLPRSVWREHKREICHNINHSHPAADAPARIGFAA